jgi:hypothetical protein
MLDEKRKEWEVIKKNGFIKWWINDGIIKFFIPAFIVIVIIVNPIIFNNGLNFFSSEHFIKSVYINAMFLIVLSLIKAFFTWKIIDNEYKKEVNL